jgi:hypothetical protein
MPPTQTVPAGSQMTPQQRAMAQDQQATRSILSPNSRVIDRQQTMATATVFPASNPVLLIQPINVGLIKRYKITVSGVIANTGSTTITLSDFGLANIFGQNGIQYTDLNNYQRVLTSGMHLTMLADAKRRHPNGATAAWNNVGLVTATNRSQMLNTAPASWGVFQAPTTILTNTTANFRAVFELPLAYSDDDLRGAVWAQVLNAVQQIQLTFNQQAVVAQPNDDTFAVYSGPAGSAGSITQATVTLDQYYLDQLPTIQGQGGPQTLLPQLSLATVYELKSLVQGSITQNQENYYLYANQRSFASTYLLYNSTGQAGGRAYGSDISYLGLLTASSTYVWKKPPLLVAMEQQDHLMNATPAGVYYLPTRRKNISTLQFGNQQLVINPTSTASGAYINIMLEDFALLNTLQSGPGLAS